MIVFSKFALTELSPPKYLGPFDSVPYTCHEVGHTWNSSCVGSWAGIFVDGFWFSLKLYIPLYLIAAAFQLRRKDADKKKISKQTATGILQSSLFLASNGTSFVASFCAYRAILGKCHGIFGYISGFVSAVFSIIIERKSRRGLLALYMGNLAAEAAFKMLVSRGYVTPVDRGEVYLFAIASALYIGLFRSCKLPKSIQNIFERVLGEEETGRLRSPDAEHLPSRSRFPLVDFVKLQHKKLVNFLDSISPKTPTCRHAGSCSSYAVRGAIEFFSVGFCLQVLMKYGVVIKAISMKKFYLLKDCFTDLSLPKFMCAYITLFRVTNCILRFTFGHDNSTLFGGISGFVAGLSSVLYKSTSITMYAVSKMLEILVMKAVAADWLPYFRNFDIFLYSVSMAVIYHCAVFEPQNIRPSYWKFACRLSGNRFQLMFRLLLDKYGTQASKLYPTFVPNLDVTKVKSDEVKRVLAVFGKWPYAL